VQSGLQVEAADGNWIDAPPLDGSFVVNIGELLELASDGYLKATVHRVFTPPATTDRLSVAFFLGANLNAQVPLLTLPQALAAQARGVTRDPANPLIRNRSQRSGRRAVTMFHPSVVLEEGHVVGRGFDSQRNAGFVVHLDRGLAEAMLHARALDPGGELRANLLGHLWRK
jgi:hypothetical protein